LPDSKINDGPAVHTDKSEFFSKEPFTPCTNKTHVNT